MTKKPLPDFVVYYPLAFVFSLGIGIFTTLFYLAWVLFNGGFIADLLIPFVLLASIAVSNLFYRWVITKLGYESKRVKWIFWMGLLLFIGFYAVAILGNIVDKALYG